MKYFCISSEGEPWTRREASEESEIFMRSEKEREAANQSKSLHK